MLKFLLRSVFITIIINGAYGLENGLARTPPMGWMHWERFRCITDCEKYPDECIRLQSACWGPLSDGIMLTNENLFKRTADLMVSEGYADVGYEYVIIDDCWLEKDRDNVSGRLVEDKQRFPSGLKALADYIHEKGLKFGLYQDYGTNTCAGYPGVIDHMELDAQTFAEWDVDYVKLDGCYADTDSMDEGYPEFGRFLNRTGRPMVYSCSWPVYQEVDGKLPNYEALKKHCNLWRNWNDIEDSYYSLTTIMDYFSKNQDRIQPHAGPGHWNDPDMLLLGNFGLTYDQSKIQMAVWSVLAAPLLMSTDLATVRPEIKEILQNRDIIAVNQDPLGIQGRREAIKNGIEVWTRPITPINSSGHHSYAVAFTSRRDDGAPYSISFNLKDIGLNNQKGYYVVDLFDNSKFIGHFGKGGNSILKSKPTDSIEVRVNPTGVKFYKFTAQ